MKQMGNLIQLMSYSLIYASNGVIELGLHKLQSPYFASRLVTPIYLRDTLTRFPSVGTMARGR